MVHNQRFFRELLTLVGKKIALCTKSTAETVSGTLVYVMFDSLLLDTEKGKQVVRFDDLAFLDPID